MPRIEKRRIADGSTRYKAIVRRKGHPLRTKTCRTRAQAVNWARKVENAILDGRVVPSQKEQNRTLGDLLDRWQAEVLPQFKSRSGPEQRSYLTWWRSKLGSETRLSEIRRPTIDQALRELARGDSPTGKSCSPATCNRYLAALRRVFNVAINRWDWKLENPASGMALPEPRGRVRFLSDDERERLLEACRASSERRLYPLVLLALSTGARRGELLALKWPDIDFERRRAVIQKSKNDDRRPVTLRGPALEQLQQLGKIRQLATDLVFADNRGVAGYPRGAFEKAIAEAEIEDFKFHDLRHSAASYLAMSGATPVELAAILGHKTLQMVQRYAHLTDEHTAGVVERMNERIFGDG